MYRNFRHFFLLTLILFLVFPLRAQTLEGLDYKFRHLTSSHGLSNNQISSIHKDRYGFVWFGTVSGLNRYDGHSFKIYKNIPGDNTTIPFNNVQRIFEDHRGHLWIFSQDNQLAIFDPSKDVFYTDYDLLGRKDPVPSEFISSLVVDHDSNLWIATNQYGVFKVDSESGRTEQFYELKGSEKDISSDFVTDIIVDSDSTVMLVNAMGGVERLDCGSGQVVYSYQPEVLSDVAVADYYSIFVDRDNDIWIYSEQSDRGLFYYDISGHREVHFSVDDTRYNLASNIVTGILQDDKGHIWVGTDHGGIQIIDKTDFSVIYVRKTEGASNSLTQNSITSLISDDSGTIWVGTYKEGVNYYHPDLFQFKLYSHNPFSDQGLPANDINCFAGDDEGNLFIGTNGNGLILYDRQQNDFSVFRANSSNPDSLSHDVIVSLLYDSKDRLWVGTYYGGLNCFRNGRFKRYYHDTKDPGTISDNRIWKIFEDSEGRIWVGTLGGGLDLLDEANNRFLHYRDGDLNSVNSNFILDIEEDDSGNLWVGTSFGVNKLDKTTGRFSHIAANPGKENALSHHIVLAILEDQHGVIWFGTRNGLNMYDPHNGRFRLFLERDGLPDNNILNLLEDEAGNIWMSTLKGLSRLEIDRSSEKKYSFSNFDLLDGLQGREFNEHSAYMTSEGELIFGGPDGFNLFNPSEIQKSTHIPEVLITGLRLFNKEVEVNENISRKTILEKPLFLADTLILRHNQNVFSLEFSGMGFFHPEKIKYQYILEGFNQDWVSADASNPLATYTNLNYGTYRFRVRAKVGEGGPLSEETSLVVIITPPFYATKYAYAAYFILFAALVVFFGYVIRRRERIKYDRQRELMEYERIHEMDAMKIRFFTNVSHEFRTPLTLILTPLEKLIRELKDPSVKDQLNVVVRNARRLLALVNQLLDFRKIEERGIVLYRSKADIVAFVKEVALSFSDLFESKSINFVIDSNVDSLQVSFDSDKLEKIIFNLLSNAFKFSPENGEVKLQVEYLADSVGGIGDNNTGKVRISVSDKGIGIPPGNQEKIFERFFQADSEGAHNLGSGIGLAITREFVRLHGGKIHVESQPGRGSIFIVDLPVVLDEDVGVSSLSQMEISTGKQKGHVAAAEPAMDDSQKPLLLIVEDNEDLRFYLKENLRTQYRIVEAANGNEGLEKASSVFPDVVISDIMMPGMDGVALCKALKTDSKTSHIPVILLTAKVSSEQEIEGLGAGADDYITKPFNYEILAIKIHKQIELRQKLRVKLEKQHFDIAPGEIGVTSLDEKFIKKAAGFVEKNIANTELSVEMFSREMGVSRGHLYNKIVALTGKTPTEFIRIMRLKRGAQLLGKSQLNVGEVAFKVGFNDPKYFSRYFKEEFGVSPSEYVKRIEKNG